MNHKSFLYLIENNERQSGIKQKKKTKKRNHNKFIQLCFNKDLSNKTNSPLQQNGRTMSEISLNPD